MQKLREQELVYLIHYDKFDGSNPPATTGTSPNIAFFDNKFFPRLGVMKSPINLSPDEVLGNILSKIA